MPSHARLAHLPHRCLAPHFIKPRTNIEGIKSKRGLIRLLHVTGGSEGSKDVSTQQSATSLGEDPTFRTRNRHLLRAILRECSYFPDPFAADWIHEHVLSRFRTYNLKAWKHRNDNTLDDRLKRAQRKGRQALYQMQKANQGDKKLMFKALHSAYGRLGRRRRELMDRLLQVGRPLSSTQLLRESDSKIAPLSTSSESYIGSGLAGDDIDGRAQDDTSLEAALASQLSVAGHSQDPKHLFSAPVYALAHSQMTLRPPGYIRTVIRRVKPAIDERNAWGKPMPQCRIKNSIAKFNANLLANLLPPLPAAEWTRLRDLASGRLEFAGPVPRRKRLSQPPSALEMALMQGKINQNSIEVRDGHNITARFMRRMWAEVFSQCPQLEYDGEKEKWTVTWGFEAISQPDVVESHKAAVESAISLNADSHGQ